MLLRFQFADMDTSGQHVRSTELELPRYLLSRFRAESEQALRNASGEGSGIDDRPRFGKGRPNVGQGDRFFECR